MTINNNYNGIDFSNVHHLFGLKPPSFEDAHLFVTGFESGTTKLMIQKILGAMRVGFVDMDQTKMVAQFPSATKAQSVLADQLRSGIECGGATLILRLATALETSSAFM